jgi:hypothetical protein
MTAQIGEQVNYNGEDYLMAAQPFDVYLKNHNIRTVSNCTANKRGYFGKWEIKDDKLFLVSITAHIFKDYKGILLRNKDGSYMVFTVNLDYFFPEQEAVFADWFSGEIRIPCGDIMKYVHGGYSSTFEEDLFLEFKDGLLINKWLIDNRTKTKQILLEHTYHKKKKQASFCRGYVVVPRFKEYIQ